MRIKINIETLIIFIFVITATLLNPLFDNIFIQYIDEMFMIFAIMRIFIKYKKRIKNNNRNMQLFRSTILYLIIIAIVGVISNANSGLVGIQAIIIDLIGMIKAPIVFIYVACICSDVTKKKTSKILRIIAQIYILIVFLFGVINLVTDIGMSYDVRYGIRTYEFIYRNPAALNEVIFCFLGVIYKEVKNKYILLLYSLCAIITVLLTLRGAALGLVVIFIYLFIVMKKNKNFKLKVSHIIIGVIGVCVVAKNQFVEYFMEESPRSLMLRNSIIVLKKYFPLGAGFATYGSDQAFKNYSPLYSLFGYNNIYWLSKEGGYAANDNFWPMIIGQFGCVGIIIYIYILVNQFRFVMKNKVGKNEKLIQIVLFTLLIISSVGNAIFTSVSGMLIYVFIALLMKDE